ncbi:GNAT family N-acetyltransferase [Amaricoccus sp.]|uniref:GNAT family N-acetyltransferase n=1 Tax=Amaricoccus sp. TaxID=1872485 RepID=UPI0025C08632|nr:GNAT family N-acetyltransferase [Amaricoccus sp.]
MPTIRDARPKDADAIAAIWNPVILSSVATFNEVPRGADEVRAMMAGRAADGHPWLVAEAEGRLAGFATYAQFRSGVGYAHTMEHTIILAEGATGKGLGPRLLGRLVGIARASGVHSLVAAVSGENPAAVAFHEREGFRIVGRIPEAGRKFERWFDLVLLQRLL